MKGRVPSSLHDKHFFAEIWVTNWGDGKFKVAAISRQVYESGPESAAFFVTAVNRKQRKIKAELKLKAEFYKKMPEFKIIWLDSKENS